MIGEDFLSKLQKAINPNRFKFVLIYYSNSNQIENIKNFIKEKYPSSPHIVFDPKNKEYWQLAEIISDTENGFLFIDRFDDFVINANLYIGFNQRRDKIAAKNINIICFAPIYQKEKVIRNAMNNIRDFWEFRTTSLDAGDGHTAESMQSSINIQQNTGFSSIGGLDSESKRREISRLSSKLSSEKNNNLRLNYYIQLSTLYRDLGDFNKALEFVLKALDIKQRVLDKSHPSIATSYNNLSTLYQGLGDLNKALEFRLKDLDISERVLDKNHPDLAISYNNLSTLYQDLGDLNKALEFGLKALGIRERVLDKNHPDLAISYNNLSTLYQDLGDLNKALEFGLKALGIRERVLDKNHSDLANSYGNLSTIYQDLGDLNKALEFGLKANDIFERVLDKNHPYLATSYGNLSVLYQALGDLDKALEFGLKANSIFERVLDKNHPSLAISNSNLSSLYQALGDLNKAECYKQKSIAFPEHKNINMQIF